MVSNNNTHPSLGVQDPAPKTTKITKNIKLYVVNTGLYFLEMYLFRIVDAKCQIVTSTRPGLVLGLRPDFVRF